MIRKLILGLAVIVLLFAAVTRSQAPATPYSQYFLPAQTSVNCPTPATGYTIYCMAYDKFQVSLNGAAYVVIWPATVTAGVTSVTVNGGTPQSGAVLLTIPTTATTIVTSSATTTIK
jgi:hypothetical protein